MTDIQCVEVLVIVLATGPILLVVMILLNYMLRKLIKLTDS